MLPGMDNPYDYTNMAISEAALDGAAAFAGIDLDRGLNHNDDGFRESLLYGLGLGNGAIRSCALGRRASPVDPLLLAAARALAAQRTTDLPTAVQLLLPDLQRHAAAAAASSSTAAGAEATASEQGVAAERALLQEHLLDALGSISPLSKSSQAPNSALTCPASEARALRTASAMVGRALGAFSTSSEHDDQLLANHAAVTLATTADGDSAPAPGQLTANGACAVKFRRTKKRHLEAALTILRDAVKRVEENSAESPASDVRPQP